MARPQVADGGTASKSCEYINKWSRTADNGWYFSLGVKTYVVTKYSYSKLRKWTDTLVRPKQRKRGIRFGMRNFRSV